MNDIESAPFLWPHFIVKGSFDVEENLGSHHNLWQPTPLDRKELLTELTSRLNLKSTLDIGLVHRLLSQPVLNLNGKPVGKLGSSLARASQSALGFVCVDLGVLPLGKLGKPELIQELIRWVSL